MMELQDCCNIELRPAENGFILRYCEKTQTGNSAYDYTTKQCEEIFSYDDGMKALDRMKELYETGDDDSDES